MSKLNTLLLGGALGSMALLSSCGSESANTTSLKDFEDVIKLSKRSDGLYNVICKDGTVEIGKTLDDLMKDNVCKKSSDDNQLPDMDQVKIETGVPRGSGCKLVDDKPTALSQIIKIKDQTLALATSFKMYSVDFNNGPKGKRKFCAETLNLTIPEGWQVAAKSVANKGTAKLPSGNNAKFTYEIGFQTSDGKKKLSIEEDLKKSDSDVLDGDFSIDKDVEDKDAVWSECGKNFPLEIKSSLRIKGEKSDNANVSMIGKSGDGFVPTQFVVLQWKKCK